MNEAVKTTTIGELVGRAALPPVVSRSEYESTISTLRVREKALRHEADLIAAALRRLPMVPIAPDTPLIGPRGRLRLLDAFEGRHQLLAYYFMWNPGQPPQAQCEGCTFYTHQVGDQAALHSRDITFAVFCQGRNTASTADDPQQAYEDSLRYRDMMGWTMPWYSAQPSLDTLLQDREHGLFHLIAYLRSGSDVFETYWTTRRGVEHMDHSYALMDLTVYGRQEQWEDSPPGWPQHCTNTRTATGQPQWRPTQTWPGGRPLNQWSALGDPESPQEER